MSQVWSPVPGKDKLRRIDFKADKEFEITPKTHLRKYNKSELVDEVHRLQTLIRSCAVELGIARETKSSEYSFSPHFASNIIARIKAGWSFNL